MKQIQLTQGQIATVDKMDFSELNKHNWNCRIKNDDRCIVLKYNPKTGRNITMARFLMNPPEGMVVDHINHDTLDNRRCNLRICTQAENVRNTRKYKGKRLSKYKGVTWDKEKKRWYARIYHNGKIMRLGRYKNEKEAGEAYDKKAQELFGEYAYLNKVV